MSDDTDRLIESYRREQERLLKLAGDLTETNRQKLEVQPPEKTDEQLEAEGLAHLERANSLAGTGKLSREDALKLGRIRNRKEPRKLNLGLKYPEPA